MHTPAPPDPSGYARWGEGPSLVGVIGVRPTDVRVRVVIVGTPTKVQTSTFTAKATDARGSTRFTITINPALPLAITPQPRAPVTVGSFGNLWIEGSGGVRPYQWARTAGQLPPGISLIQDNPSGPLVPVGGTPTAAGTFGFTLRLSDATGATVSRTFSVTVN